MFENLNLRNKKGAFEMSITTVVIIVIAMTFLILGLILVRNIFSGATDATDLINENVKSQINQLFNDQDTKSVIYLADNSALVEKGETYNVGLGIRNVGRGGSGSSEFSYEIKAVEVESGCDITLDEADSFIISGRTGGPWEILAGDDPLERVAKVRVADDAPLCVVTYDLIVKENGETYDVNFFILEIEA